jgi:hypothetical protein
VEQDRMDKVSDEAVRPAGLLPVGRSAPFW